MAQYLTLSSVNKARVKCPIFNTTVNVASCVNLRDKVWRNERVDVRRGCQACMRCSKCPVAKLITKISFSSTYPDNLGSKEPKLLNFSDDVLTAIKNVVVLENVMDHFNVPDIERQLIYSAQSRIEEAIKSASGKEPNKSTVLRTSKSTTTDPTQKDNSFDHNLKTAAITGDLAAALRKE